MTLRRTLADLEAAQSDVVRLQAELSLAQARVAKLEGFLVMLREYGAEAVVAPEGPPVPAPCAPPFKAISSNARVAAAEQRAAIVRAVLPMLRPVVWTPSFDLVPAVHRAGLLADKDKTKAMVRLREVLAKAPGVESSSGKGYRLRAQAPSV